MNRRLSPQHDTVRQERHASRDAHDRLVFNITASPLTREPSCTIAGAYSSHSRSRIRPGHATEQQGRRELQRRMREACRVGDDVDLELVCRAIASEEPDGTRISSRCSSSTRTISMESHQFRVYITTDAHNSITPKWQARTWRRDVHHLSNPRRPCRSRHQ